MNSLKVVYYNFGKEAEAFDKNTLAISFINGKVKSVYGDDEWDFTHENASNISLNEKVLLNFSELSKYPKIKEAVKDGIYKLLSNGLKTTTLMSHYKNIKSFIEYITKELGIGDLNEVKIDHVRLYINSVISQNLSYSTCKSKLLFLENLFFKYRNELKYKFDFHPFEGRELSSIVKKSSSVKALNQTEIIADATWKKIVDLAINKIKAYQEHLDVESILHDAWIKEYESKKNGNHKDKTLNFRKVFNHKDFIPYNKGLKQFESITQYKEYTKDVIVSCGIVIQAFTGMRISELMSLKKGCCIEEEIELNGSKIKVRKINGLTFKYQKQIEDGQVGKEADWLCPEIVFEAVKALESINRTAHYIFRDKDIEEYLFIMSGMKGTDKLTIYNVSEDYKDFIEANGIEIDFKLTSHCFRRTLARFFARNLLSLPVETLKEQFKHFSKDITLYYMKEDLKNDGSFSDLINDYAKNGNNKLIYEEVNNKFNHSILSANNLDEIRYFVGTKQVSLINEYMATLEKENKGISPFKSLTCEGTIILPGIHLDYWKEMLILYKELTELEPNSIWYKNEFKMIENVVISLENGNAYIVKGK